MLGGGLAGWVLRVGPRWASRRGGRGGVGVLVGGFEGKRGGRGEGAEGERGEGGEGRRGGGGGVEDGGGWARWGWGGGVGGEGGVGEGVRRLVGGGGEGKGIPRRVLVWVGWAVVAVRWVLGSEGWWVCGVVGEEGFGELVRKLVGGGAGCKGIPRKVLAFGWVFVGWGVLVVLVVCWLIGGEGWWVYGGDGRAFLAFFVFVMRLEGVVGAFVGR